MAIDVISASGMRRHWPFTALRRARERAAADSWIVQRRHAFSTNPVVRDRVVELTSERERMRLAGSLRGAIRDAERIGISASPLNRRAISESAAELTALADRLADLDLAVAPRGVVMVLHLLTDGGSPLYGRGSGSNLRDYAEVTHAALDGA